MGSEIHDVVVFINCGILVMCCSLWVMLAWHHDVDDVYVHCWSKKPLNLKRDIPEIMKY